MCRPKQESQLEYCGKFFSKNLTPATNKNKLQIALKLNRLKDKVTMYGSHKDFLTRCIAEEQIPKGLKLELESTIGDFDQEFVDEWYSKLKGFSLKLMKDRTIYCQKTIKSPNLSIKSTEATLRNSTENLEFLNIDKILKINVEATKRQKDQTLVTTQTLGNLMQMLLRETPTPSIRKFNI